MNKVPESDHGVFLLGSTFHQNPQIAECWFVVSTRNLLMNLYRLPFMGGRLSIATDGSGRYTVEDWQLVPFMVSCPMTQKSHIIAYGVSSNDQMPCHLFFIEKILEESARIVDFMKAKNRDPTQNLPTNPKRAPTQNLPTNPKRAMFEEAYEIPLPYKTPKATKQPHNDEEYKRIVLGHIKEESNDHSWCTYDVLRSDRKAGNIKEREDVNIKERKSRKRKSRK
jgi:hypothetical protein